MSDMQLYIGSDLLDFNGKVNVKRQVADYTDLSLGGTVTSYTIDVPLTMGNKPKLGYIEDVRSRVEVTEQARLVANGMEIIRGKLRILRANTEKCVIIIEGNDWISDISGISIKDLSWAGGDEHEFTSANILASWTAAAGAFYRYPLINFGGLISGDHGLSGSDLFPYDFYMGWHIETIITKILLDAGYTLDTSGFFASTFGRSLYLFSDPKPALDDFISGKELAVSVTNNSDNSDTTFLGIGASGGVNITKVLDINTKTTDEGNDWSIANDRYTVPADGTYRFQAQIKIDSDMNNGDGTVYTVTLNSLTWSIRNNSSPIFSYSNTGNNLFDTGNSFTLDTGYIYLEAGDHIDIYVNAVCQGTNISGVGQNADIFIIQGTISSFFTALWSEHNLWPGVGQTISPSKYLPDMDSIDLLKGLKEAFNLRFWVDRNNKKVYCETSDDFYGSTVIDWTDKIDYSSLPGLEVIASKYEINQKFRWKPSDGDKAYDNFVASSGVPFEKELILESEYAKAGLRDNENLALAATVLGDMPQIGHFSQSKIPRIFGGNEFVGSGYYYPPFRSKEWGPRIMEWKGMVALTKGDFDYFDDFEDTSGTNYTTFPSMETPDMNDVFDDFMVKDWNRIEKNKIVTCELVLTPAEIMKFMTVVGTAANEGFRATYKMNIEGVEMYFMVGSIITDGNRVKAVLIQKL